MPETTPLIKAALNLRVGAGFDVYDEKLVVLYCKQLGINYKNLSDEEFRWQIGRAHV